MTKPRKLLIVQVAALGYSLVREFPELAAELPLSFQPLKPCFPAVTCTAQATFRTATPPAHHGIVCNGVFQQKTRSVEFWNQSSFLLSPERIWTSFRQHRGTVGMMFWQQSLGEQVDLLLSPAPIHKHGGGMIQGCYSRPGELSKALRQALPRPFNLMHYWGPLASVKSTRWITDATIEVLSGKLMAAPDLLMTYLPHLDYTLQKKGPLDSNACQKAFSELIVHLKRLCDCADEHGYHVLIWGDYAITPADKVIFPNALLRKEGLFHVRQVGNMTYPDLYSSPAFAMVDHQVAHVYVQAPKDIPRVRDCLAHVPGVDAVAVRSDILPHQNSGDLILTAAPGAWFAYPWWENKKQAPDYATHVDIHNKIGFDPCELFFGKLLPPQVSLDTSKVMGTHGRVDAPAAYATDLPFEQAPDSLLALAENVQKHLDA